MAGPLEGYRIIDLTQMIAGPMATMILGDQGADVIKIEPPRLGDGVRGFGSRRPGLPATYVTGVSIRPEVGGLGRHGTVGVECRPALFIPLAKQS